MVPVLTAAEMREADRRTIEEIGLPGAVLMENAGAAVARLIQDVYPAARRIHVLCGRGNNGGDGFVVARHLMDRECRVALLGSRGDLKGDAELHCRALERSGGLVQEAPDTAGWERDRSEVFRADLIVDALLGTGLEAKPTGVISQAIRDLADYRGPVVAVDLPSGLASDTGEVAWETVRATLTVACAALKLAHVLPPACDRAGDVRVVDIGIPQSLLVQSRLFFRLEAPDAARAYPGRSPAAHKGTFGHLLIVGGGVGKTGAAVLAARGALRSGVGLVTVATTPAALPSVAAGRPEIMTEALPASALGCLDGDAVEPALALARARDAVVLGPGLGMELGVREFVRGFVPRCPVPLLVDADGLNALAASAGVPSATGLLRRRELTVITPHPGEMARLVGSTPREIQRLRLETTRAVSRDTGAVVVLKGQGTLVAEPSGRAAVNPTGNPAMATGGMGDVLAGVLGALLARGADPWTAATAAVYLHGLAGDRASVVTGPESLLAGDVVEALPEALRAVGVAHP